MVSGRVFAAGMNQTRPGGLAFRALLLFSSTFEIQNRQMIIISHQSAKGDLDLRSGRGGSAKTLL